MAALVDLTEPPNRTYTLAVRISYDPAKNERKRNLSFDLAAEFEFEDARIWIDSRQDYGEVRYVAVGRVHNRLHFLCSAETPEGIRVISFRKANQREVDRYVEHQTPDRR